MQEKLEKAKKVQIFLVCTFEKRDMQNVWKSLVNSSHNYILAADENLVCLLKPHLSI